MAGVRALDFLGGRREVTAACPRGRGDLPLLARLGKSKPVAGREGLRRRVGLGYA